MLLIICHSSANRYAIDSRFVSAVLPRAHLHRLSGSPDWLAGVLIYRERTTPIVDLTQLTDGMPCPNRLSSRIVVLQAELGGSLRRFGILAERVGLREIDQQPGKSGDEADGPAALGTLHLDEQGVYQLIDLSRLICEDRQAILFPATAKQHY
jgi:chemotaxis-related protein WspB